jgi:single-strand DNA-binding protein
MSALNSVQLVGRLTHDAEVRLFTSGKELAKFSLAVDHYNGTETKTFFFNNIELWSPGNRVNWLVTGKLVAVEGELHISTWEDDNGKHQRMFIRANNVAPLASPKNQRQSEDAPIEVKAEVVPEGQLVDF